MRAKDYKIKQEMKGQQPKQDFRIKKGSFTLCSGKTVSHYFNNVKEVDMDVMTQLQSLPR